jgi:glutamine amidotransferase
MLTIIDLDIGNLSSVANAFRRITSNVSIVDDPELADNADIVVLPGVGAFEPAVSRLRARGFDTLIQEHVRRGKALIGVCLGMQLLADHSEENGLHKGLGLVSGQVIRLEAVSPEDRVPNIGWVPVTAVRPSPMFPRGEERESFYHVHSYHLVCQHDADVAAIFEHGGKRIVTAIHHDNIFGMQFHPEKSQDAGLTLLESLLTHIGERL